MKLYISGAITNNPNYREEFQYAEAVLKSQGYTVINPVKNIGFSYKEYIDMALNELMHCEAIYMIGDYKSSKGALLELQYAKTVGLEIVNE